MKLSTYTNAYGDMRTATHVLAQRKDYSGENQYYGPRTYQGHTYHYTKFIDAAHYFPIDTFAEEGYRELIENLPPADNVFLRFCDFGDKEPYGYSKMDLESRIFKKPKTFSGSFSQLIINLQDIRKVQGIEKEEPKPMVIKQIFTEFDPTKTTDYRETTEYDDCIVVKRGVLEPIDSEQTHQTHQTIDEYSDQLKPDQTEYIKGKNGYKYTTAFYHPYGKGIAQEPEKSIIRHSIYEYYHDEKVTKNDPNLAKWDIQNTQKHAEKGIRIKQDKDILKFYPDAQLGKIIREAKRAVEIIPTNHIVKHQHNSEPFTELDDNIAPTALNPIPLRELLENCIHSKLYNIPLHKINYTAKWYNGASTNFDPSRQYNYQTPLEASKILPDNMYYGVTIDVSNVANREHIVDALRTFLLERIARNVNIPTTVSAHFNERIIIKIEPFAKTYEHPNVLSVVGEPHYGPDISNFTKRKWNQLYTQWAKSHRDLIKSNQLNEKFNIDQFWANSNDVQTDQRIHPPKENVPICYINYHPASQDVKIGRSKNWESRYSLYTRTNPPIVEIDPDCILRYYLKSPVHEDHVVTEYLYSCMEDFMKKFSDEQHYLKRHKSPAGHLTEYYSLETELSINQQLNTYVAAITEAFLNLTLKDLADMRTPSVRGDGIHGGKRQEFFNKLNAQTGERTYDVERALNTIAKLDNTTKFRDYPEYQTLFLPEFKNM